MFESLDGFGYAQILGIYRMRRQDFLSDKLKRNISVLALFQKETLVRFNVLYVTLSFFKLR